MVASTTADAVQRQELSLHGAQGEGAEAGGLPESGEYRYLPEHAGKYRPTTSPSSGALANSVDGSPAAQA